MSNSCNVSFTFFITSRTGQRTCLKKSFPRSIRFCKENGFESREGEEMNHTQIADTFARFLMLDENTETVETFAQTKNGEEVLVNTLNWR